MTTPPDGWELDLDLSRPAAGHYTYATARLAVRLQLDADRFYLSYLTGCCRAPVNYLIRCCDCGAIGWREITHLVKYRPDFRETVESWLNYSGYCDLEALALSLEFEILLKEFDSAAAAN